MLLQGVEQRQVYLQTWQVQLCPTSSTSLGRLIHNQIDSIMSNAIQLLTAEYFA